MRKLFITLFVFIAFGALLWTQRVAILDWIVEAQKVATLPEAVTYEEVVEEGQKEQGTEGIGDAAEVEVAPIVEETEDVAEEPEEALQDDIETMPDEVSDTPSETEELPLQFNLAVPFTSQAPNGDWSEPYQEACEEASIYMVHRDYEGDPTGTVDPQTADAGIWEVVNFENALLGFYKDTTAVQTAIVVEQMYGYGRVDVLEDPTVDEIKAHVAAGRPVIVPAAGRQLGNPFFTPPGPVYHMLVIKGYTEDTFITNDPGTRRGENYSYNVDALMSAIHDWNDGDVENGKKVAIVVYPNN